MDEADWNSGFARSLMVFLNGDAIPELDAAGRPDHGRPLFARSSTPTQILIRSHFLPAAELGQNWLIRLDTATGQVDPLTCAVASKVNSSD